MGTSYIAFKKSADVGTPIGVAPIDSTYQIFDGEDNVIPLPLSARSIPVPVSTAYGLWRMDGKSGEYISGAIATEWMLDVGSYLKASGANASVSSGGLFGNKLSLNSTAASPARLYLGSQEVAPSASTVLMNILDPGTSDVLTVEYFFKITNALSANQACLLSVGLHQWDINSPAKLLINVEKNAGAWNLIRMLVRTSTSLGPYSYGTGMTTYVSSTLAGSLADGAWHHMAIVKTAALAMKLYVDGALCFSSTSVGAALPSLLLDTYICSSQPDPSNNGDSTFQADIDTLRITNGVMYGGAFSNPVLGADLASPAPSSVLHGNNNVVAFPLKSFNIV